MILSSLEACLTLMNDIKLHLGLTITHNLIVFTLSGLKRDPPQQKALGYSVVGSTFELEV
jgi:hypothetical protein